MAYREPGARARFVKTASMPTLSNTGVRTLALVGTGINYYNVTNETVLRNSDRPYDTLAHENIFEVSSVSSLPVYSDRTNPENIFYEQGVDYVIKDGKYIVWRTLSDTFIQPELVNVDTDPYATEGCRAFENQCRYYVDANNYYFVVDGEWRIEVTFANKELGCYRIIKVDTNEAIGEYVCGPEINTAIPGINLIVPSTYKLPDGADVDSEENEVVEGDYFIIKTIACKTEVEAEANIVKAASVTGLRNSIKKVNIINPEKVVDGTYRMVIRNAATSEFQVVKLETSGSITTETVIYPDPDDTSVNATWIKGDEVYDIIPGVEIILDAFKYTPSDNDHVTIETIARIVDDTIPGEQNSYYISYKYRKDAAGYEPQYFSDYDDVVAEYGEYEVTASGYVKNSLTLGAQLAFQNGIENLILVQAKGTADGEFCDAIDRLKKDLPGVDNVNTVVPLTTSAAVGAYCANHVDLMSSYEMGKERMCYLASYFDQPMSKHPSGSDRTMGIIETCKGYYNERVVYVVPGKAIKSIRNIRNGLYYDRPLPGCYLAVAVACLGLRPDPAEPITNKNITGFSYLPDVYTKAEMNLMAGNGALILCMRGNNIYVRHGITTCPTEVNTMEITCIQIKDYIIEAVRTTCGLLYIGLKNTNNVVADVEFTVKSILSQFVNAVIIENYSGLSVKRSSEDPRKIDIKFQVLPIYSLTYIDIAFGFSVATSS